MQNMSNMTRRLALICIASILTMGAMAQKGNTWSGKLNVYGTELTLVFHLDGDSCTLDSPDQGVKGVPGKLETTTLGVKVTVPAINATFEGVYFKETLMGTFSQLGQAFPLTLKKGELKRNRPQTPVPPFPYQTEEVSFSNGTAVLSGTLVLPQNCQRQTPVLLMVTGSGLQNRDEEIFEHKPFAVIADALARQGIATLRYDDRGFGASKGDIVNMTTEDLKNDALAGIQLLRTRFDHVGILGHSEGGTIALMLAAEGKTDFVVSMAANVVSGERTLLQQNRWALQQAGYSQEVTDSYIEALTRLFDDLKNGRIAKMPDTSLPPALQQNLQVVMAQGSTPYMRHFLTVDVSKELGNITCPVLALGGTNDRQVSCEENLGALRSGLTGKKDIHAVDGVNHLFQHSKTGDPTEYKDIEETIAPEVLDLITAWLKHLAACQDTSCFFNTLK